MIRTRQRRIAAGTLPLVVCACQLCGATSPESQDPAPTRSMASEPQSEAASHLMRENFIDIVKRLKSHCVAADRTTLRCSGPIQIDNLKNTFIAGQGMKVEFLDSRPGTGGIIMHDPQNVALSDLEIGWQGGEADEPAPAGVQRIQSFGGVEECSSGVKGGVLQLDYPAEGLQPLGAVSVWDDHLGWPWYREAPVASEVYLPTDTSVEFSKGRSPCLPQLNSLVGSRVLVRHLVYAISAVSCWNCRNVTIEKVRVTSVPGMSFVFEGGGSDLILRDNVIAPKCSPKCRRAKPSGTADGAHFSDVQGNILLEGNDFGWQGDDAVNITGLLVPCEVQPDQNQTPQWLTVDGQWWNRVAGWTIGEDILIFDQGLTSIGHAQVLALDRKGRRIRLSWLPGQPKQMLLARSNGVPRRVIIRSNHFHDNRARGILIGGSDAMIENNTIERVTMEAILIPADTGPWYEGPGATKVLITRNRISDVNRYPDTVSYPSAISAGVKRNKDYKGSYGIPIHDIRVEKNSYGNIYTNADTPVYDGLGAEVRMDDPKK